ncbi:hypothetical protein [Burkholderia sp. Bp9031]|uniref:hypothetical protein n=1 Tax=Burkholderia sp. Bp9031 TaxID=2184566 RepID=UPI000F5F8DBA|nr:hypothetical protein [Burkholderia sp. Bp9031]
MKRLHDIANQSGGRCLTETFCGKAGRCRFVCAVGHEFETTAAIVLGGSWCSKCSNERRAERRRYEGGLAPIQERARERGGECLSTAYHGQTAKYRFRCAHDHEWEVTGIEVMRKAWCHQCFVERRRRPEGMEELQQAAERQGGACLATEYSGVTHEYPFQCARGHQWSMRGIQILEGGWCATCRTEERRQRGLEAMRAIAAERGGTCVSDTYIDNNTKLEWECMRGHRWWARPRVITSGSWCAQCQYLSQITRDETRRRGRWEAVPAAE